ncbi:hypothetical protein ACFSVK_20780 [Azorhizophilus paspali]|uniref:hypothetical protein n=1 Tax=Azorhizophilus paspali TaxID=69963 RepID=UPI0036376DCE
MAHHDRRRSFETLDQQAAFLVDGQVERTGYPERAPLPQPLLGRRHQGGEDGGIVDRLQHAEVARVRAVRLAMQPIHLGADAPDGLVARPGDPGLPIEVGEDRVLRRQVVAAFDEKGLHPVRVVAVEPARQADEDIEIGFALYRPDNERCIPSERRLIQSRAPTCWWLFLTACRRDAKPCAWLVEAARRLGDMAWRHRKRMAFFILSGIIILGRR